MGFADSASADVGLLPRWPADGAFEARAGHRLPRRDHDAGARSELNRSSFVPLYFQLAEVLKERIEAAEWAPGSRFPSERELCEEFAVSRTVVRPALDMLEGDGQLVRVKGRGTFVAPRKTTDRIRGLTRMLAAPIPRSTVVQVLDAYEQAAEPYVARSLGIDMGARVAHVTTLTRMDGRPLFLCDSFVAEPLAETVLEAVRPRELTGLESPLVPARLGRAHVAIQTSFCSEFESEQLEIAAGGLVILIRCVEHDRSEVPIEMARIVYRADIVELDGELA